MSQAADGEQFERAAHLRDAIRTIGTLSDRQQKMESPSLGDRDAFGLKVGAAGAVVQVVPDAPRPGRSTGSSW